MVVSLHVMPQSSFQFSGAAMDSAAQLAFRRGSEPALDQVDPRHTRWAGSANGSEDGAPASAESRGSATLKKDVGKTALRLVLVRVANSEETANIDPDTGLHSMSGLRSTMPSLLLSNISSRVDQSRLRSLAPTRATESPVSPFPRLRG